MRIAVCDDESQECERIKILVEECCRQRSLACIIESYSSGEAFLEAMSLQAGTTDIVFLDIYMNGSNGIVCAEKIRELDKNCKIVFTTNSLEHAVQGFNINALHYLIKPVRSAQIDTVLDRFAQSEHRMPEPFIQRQNKQGCYRIQYRDIRFVESCARVLKIHTEKQGVISIYERLDDFEQACHDRRFFRCHKSYLVNLDYIHSIFDKRILLHTGEHVRVSIRLSEAKKKFAQYKAARL